MLGGVSHLNLDPKNRVAIPSRYREFCTLDNVDSDCNVVITLESADCLLIYPESSWALVRDKIQNLPGATNPLVKSYQRLVLGYAQSVNMDKSGRILIANHLKDMVNIKKEVTLVGIGNRFELWDHDKWEMETKKALQLPHEQLSNVLQGFSL